MKKPTLESAAAKKAEPDYPEPSPAKRTKVADGKMTTSMRIEPEKLETLKIIAARRRVRVNDLVLHGVDHVIALHKQGRAA